MRALGKLLARKFRLSYSGAAHAIVRSCGFADFEDALVNRVLYYKVFVDTIPTSLSQWRNKALPQTPTAPSN